MLRFYFVVYYCGIFLIVLFIMEDDEQDVYVAQLREVFVSCYVNGNGYLSSEELVELCQKLQLEDHVSKLLAQLLGERNEGQVKYLYFYHLFFQQ